MRKLLSALTLTLLLTVNTLAAAVTPSVTEPPPADLSAWVEVIFDPILVLGIAIPNLLKT
jgi:hypothetical protein